MSSNLLVSVLIVLLVVVSPLADTVASDLNEGQQLLILIGAPGQPRYGNQFVTWAERWQKAVDGTSVNCRVIGQNDADSDKAEFIDALHQYAATTSPEPLWIVLIGHGTYDGRTARFNLRGPDITASEIAELLREAHRPVVLINCASGSAPFINQLSAPDRAIVTSTRDGNQIQFARFGDALSAAVSGSEADLDQDGQVSLLEACVLASRRTEEFYESEGRLATEHALLDDNGDGLGTRCSDWKGVRLELESESAPSDGRLSRTFHLVRSKEERQLSVKQRQTRDQLERRLEELRKHRYEFPESEYLDRLELILRPLAELYRVAEQSDNEPSPLIESD